MTDRYINQWTAQDLLEYFEDFDQLSEEGGEWSSMGVICNSPYANEDKVEFGLYKGFVADLENRKTYIDMPENTVAEYSVVISVGGLCKEVGYIYETADGEFILSEDYGRNWLKVSKEYNMPDLVNIIQREIDRNCGIDRSQLDAYTAVTQSYTQEEIAKATEQAIKDEMITTKNVQQYDYELGLLQMALMTIDNWCKSHPELVSKDLTDDTGKVMLTKLKYEILRNDLFPSCYHSVALSEYSLGNVQLKPYSEVFFDTQQVTGKGKITEISTKGDDVYICISANEEDVEFKQECSNMKSPLHSLNGEAVTYDFALPSGTVSVRMVYEGKAMHGIMLNIKDISILELADKEHTRNKEHNRDTKDTER